MENSSTDMRNIQNLLDQVSLIKKNYNRINKITGANYNVFDVLKMRSDEERLHSRFIGDLLNPKGKHGRGDVFLKLFVEKLKEIFQPIRDAEYENDVKIQKSQDQNSFKMKFLHDFSIDNAIVLLEKDVGLINKEKTEGGKIDLIIKDKNNNRIIIENKIWASEQVNQLLRYYNYDKNALLIYLTLYGKEATIESTNSTVILDCDYFAISYKNHIKEWLEECLKETTEFPFLRETLKQYINTIKSLTGQSINKDMGKEIGELIFSSKESAIAAKTIIENYERTKSKLYKTFRIELEHEFKVLLNKEGVLYELQTDKMNKKYENIRTQIIFKNVIGLFNKNNCNQSDPFVFEFSRMYKKSSINDSFYYGFRFDNDENINCLKNFQDKLPKDLLPESNNYWLAKKSFVFRDSYEKNGNEIKFNSIDFQVEIANKTKRDNHIKRIVEEMLNVINVFLNKNNIKKS